MNILSTLFFVEMKSFKINYRTFAYVGILKKKIFHWCLKKKPKRRCDRDIKKRQRNKQYIDLQVPGSQ